MIQLITKEISMHHNIENERVP